MKGLIVPDKNSARGSMYILTMVNFTFHPKCIFMYTLPEALLKPLLSSKAITDRD